jgi:outer membrane protein, heavy metal efflux system
MSGRRFAFLQLFLSLTTATCGGCAATSSITSFVTAKPLPVASTTKVEAVEISTAGEIPSEGEIDLVVAELEVKSPATPSPVKIPEGDSAQEDALAQDVLVEEKSIAPQLTERGMTLDELEAIALANSPTIQELVATTQKAAGYRVQVGLQANPTVGYQAVQLSDAGTDQHTIYISQTIVTADKLLLNRRVLNEALRHQLLQLEAQKYRVATDLRIKFYETLAAQQRVKLIHDFQSVANKGLELAKVLKNEIDLSLQQAELSLAASWRELTAIAGMTQMTSMVLDGTLPSSEQTQDWTTLGDTLIVSSPEYQAAQARVCQARANLDRHCVQPVPNLDVQLAAGADNGTNSGLINLQIGAPIPVFNKNQGNIAAARAELARASREVNRIENSIRSRIGEVSRDYDSSMVAVEKYAKDILPNAAEGMRLAELAYKAGETGFVQVLVAQQSYFDTNLQFIEAQSKLAGARARVDGFVLSGALDAVIDESGDDSLRGLTLSQQ